jgi:hypothetical protein
MEGGMGAGALAKTRASHAADLRISPELLGKSERD